MEAAERETTIQWSDADGGLATVFTAQRPMVTRLRRLQGAKRVDVQRTKGGIWLGETWEVPVACIVVRNPRQIGEAQKRAIADRGRQALAVARRAKVTQKSTVSSRVLEPQGAEGTPTSPLTSRQHNEQEGDTGTQAPDLPLTVGESGR